MKQAAKDNNDTDVSSEIYDDLWILKFLSKKRNRYLERIPDLFLEDKFNLFGLKEKVKTFEDSYLAILNTKPSKDFDEESKLYLYIHQRYIFTKMGAENVLDRVISLEYGSCQKHGCDDYPLIPGSISNEFGDSPTMLYCHNCGNLYESRSSLRRLDGCAWGTGFPHFLILSYPYHFEKKQSVPYVPKLFGFQISEPEDNDSN